MTETTDRCPSYLIDRILITATFIACSPPLCSHRGAPPFLHPSHVLLYFSLKLISILQESLQFVDFSETTLSSCGISVGISLSPQEYSSHLEMTEVQEKPCQSELVTGTDLGKVEDRNHVGDLGALGADELGSRGQLSSEHDF